MFGMNSYREPIIDPLAIGHAKADKKLERERQQALEKEADRVAMDDEAKALEAKEARAKELEELYGDDKNVMKDIFPSWEDKN